MKRRLITVILFALVAAAISSTLIYKVVSGSKTTKPQTAHVFVAAKDLSTGTLVSETDIREVEWPVAGDSPWIAKRSDVVGRALSSPISKDEPFAESRLSLKGAGAGLASTIPPGMRAVAVHVDELTGLSKFIFPGMHVDVISTGPVEGQSAQGLVSRTILQDIEVFSTGQNVERDARDKATAVPVFDLLVTPQQAEVLSQAVAQTRIQLVLRNPLDKGNILATVAPEKAVKVVRPKIVKAVAKIAPAEKVVQASKPEPEPMTVEVIHGTKRTVSVVAAAPASESQQ